MRLEKGDNNMSILICDNRNCSDLAQSISLHLNYTYSDVGYRKMRRLLAVCYLANNNSYVGRYADGELLKEIQFLEPTKVLSPLQCLQSMECLSYNIEKEYLEYKIEEELKLLAVIIDRLKSHIIQKHPDSKSVEWNLAYDESYAKMLNGNIKQVGEE